MTWMVVAALVAGVTQRTLAGFFVCILAGLRAASRPCRPRWALVFALCVGALGYGALHGRAIAVDLDAMARWSATADRPLLTGWVCSFPRTSRYGTSFVFATRYRERPLRVLVYATRFNVGYGDSLEVRATPVHTFDRSRARALGVAGAVRARNGAVRILAGHAGDPLRRGWFWPAHRAARQRLQRALNREAGIALALVLGERGLTDRGFAERLRRLGISHLFALSGIHLGIVAGWLLLAVRRTGLRRTPRMLVLGTALAACTAIVGDVDSLQRAATMAVILVLARACDRRTTPMDALAAALVLILFARPGSVYSVGFQLSFLATAGVIAVGERLRAAHRRLAGTHRGARRVVAAAVTVLAVSAAIQAMILPLQIHYFEGVSLVGPLATVLFLAPVTGVIVSGVATAALAPLPVVGPLVAVAATTISRLTALAITAAAAVAPRPITPPSPNFYLWGAALVWWVLWRRSAAVALAGAGVLACLAFR